MNFNKSIALSTKSPRNIHWSVTIIISIVLFIIMQIVASLVLVPVLLALNPTATLNDLMKEPLNTLFSLLTFPFLLFSFILTNKFLYRHPIQALGFFKERLIPRYLLGMTFGIAIILIIYIINLMTGAMHSTVNHHIQMFTLVWVIALFMIQGLTEEVVARGFLMNKVSHQIGIPAGIIINSAFFSLLHFLNPNTNLLSFINLFLAGVVFSLLFYWSDNIWLTGAAHSFWNITLGVLLGNEVSGTTLPATILNTQSNTDMTLINGGMFGLEGGLVVTVLSIIIICILLNLCLKKYGTKKRA
ncbi:CPBP family intramembrane glutamic endopeptidase [Macrococcus equi]|uniref:CPBP family intramembrane glutamic endopeptidase n=1 Tax=Macrococcus equi TaxID=3395462 RepID=UPI0039BDD05C